MKVRILCLCCGFVALRESTMPEHVYSFRGNTKALLLVFSLGIASVDIICAADTKRSALDNLCIDVPAHVS